MVDIYQLVQGLLEAKPVPPVANRFIAYVHPSFMTQVFSIPQRKWKSHIQHEYKLDNFRNGFEKAEGNIFSHVQAANFLPQQGRAAYFDDASMITIRGYWLDCELLVCKLS